MPEINWTVTSNYAEGRYQSLLWNEESGKVHLTPYADSRKIVTVGVGVALKFDDNLRATLDYVDPTGYLNKNYFGAFAEVAKRPFSSDSQVEAAFNQIMSAASKASGGTVGKTFALKDENEGRALFTYLMEARPNNYESQLANRLPGIALGTTREHVALIDMAWNAPSLIGSQLQADIKNGDRAEAWYEIRYESNGNAQGDAAGLAKRRYVEAQTFGLYGDSKAVTLVEAKLAVRMADENAEKIKQYDGQYASNALIINDGNGKIAHIVAATDLKIDPIYTSIKQAIQPAVDKLVKQYVDLDGDLKTVQDALRLAEYEGNLLDPGVKVAHVASTGGNGSNGPGVANYSSSSENMLIIGAPSDKEVGDGGYGTTLKGGSGDDWFVGGSGKDNIDGGGGSNTVSYLDSKQAVTIDLEGGKASGGDAEGDTLKNIENIFGSRQADKITGSAEDDVIYGGGGADTIDGKAGDDVIVLGGHDAAGGKLSGGEGNDVIVGGDGSDEIKGDAGKDKLDGGKGDDRIYGGAGEDEIKGGDGNDELWGGDGSSGDTDKDTFTGGKGSDVFHAGDGDVIKDPEPGDRLLIDDDSTAGVGKRKQGSSGPYRNENGTTYDWDGNALVVTKGDGGGPHGGGGGSSVRVENFHDGDLGITLRETPKDDPRDPDTTGSIKASPLVLDLDGNGVTTVGLAASGAYFDQDLDGYSELTGWISRTDGLLALDKNGDGVVGSRSELFGYSTYDISGRFQGDGGFAKLAELDSNRDGVIDKDDAAFGSLRLWIDSDGNGVSTLNEMHTLAEIGVASIGLTSTMGEGLLKDGNYVSDRGSFTWTDGRHGDVADVWFAYDSASTQVSPGVEAPYIDPSVLSLPDMPGNGKVASLHAAMSSDPTLRAMVEHLAAAGREEIPNLSSDIEAIALRWMGADGADQLGRGRFVDGQVLSAIEHWYGRAFVQGGSETDPRPQAAAILMSAWKGLVGEIATQILAQTDLGHDILPGTSFEGGAFVVTPGGFTVLSLVESLASTAPSGAEEALAYWTSALPVIGYLGKGHDMTGVAGAFDAAMAASGIPLTFAELDPTNPFRFTAVAGPDGGTLIGRQVSGEDSTGLSQGGDVLVAGAGDDILRGLAGSDVYVETRHGGRDVIVETATIHNADDPFAFVSNGDRNEIRFVDDVRLKDLTFAQGGERGEDLVITVSGDHGTQIRVTGFFGDTIGSIGTVSFADGTSVTGGWIVSQLIKPTEGNDILFTYDAGAVMDGLGGNDDIIGGTGPQTYLFGHGSGHDRIFEDAGNPANVGNVLRFKDGILPGDVVFTRVGQSLVATLGADDSVELRDWFPSPAAGVAEFDFADGTRLSAKDVLALMAKGTPGNDHLYSDDAGNGGFNVPDGALPLDGGAGDDVLHGGSMADHYVFGRGYGRDLIIESPLSGGNVLTFKDGLGLDDLVFSRGGVDAQDLVIGIAGTDDAVTVRGGLAPGYFGKVQEFVVGGVTYSADDIAKRVPVTAATPGDDRILGSPGDDVIDGGAGDDLLKGGPGHDTYVFGHGYGHDVVSDFEQTSVVRFQPGVTRDEIRFSRLENDYSTIVLTLSDGSTLSLRDFAHYGDYGYTRFEFADGSAMTEADVRAAMTTGTDGDDVLRGFPDKVSVIDGGKGDDTVSAQSGDTVLFGRGSGHDTLDGGTPTITLKPGVAEADLAFRNDGTNLTVSIRDTGDSITWHVPFHFEGATGPLLRLPDGTVIDSDAIIERAYATARTDGNDVIVSGAKGLVLDGGRGDDTLVAGYGDAVTFVLGRGYGHDVGTGTYQGSTVRFVDGITAAELTAQASGYDLVLAVGSDSLTLRDYFRTYEPVSTVEFGDGTTITGAALADMVLDHPTQGDDVLRARGGGLVDGLAGDDRFLLQGPDAVFRLGHGTGHDVATMDYRNGGYGATGVVVSVDAGITAADLTFSRANIPDRNNPYAPGAVIVVTVTATGDSVAIPEVAFGHVLFSDGSQVEQKEIAAAIIAHDVATGSPTIHGSSLDEVMRGGAGDEYLDGNGGADTFIVGAHDGNDTIGYRSYQGKLELPDLDRDDVTFSFGNVAYGSGDVLIHVRSTGQVITLEGVASLYAGGGTAQIASVDFRDGTSMDLPAVLKAALAEGGTPGADSILGTAGDDRIDGKGGDDVLAGGDGRDTYVFGRGHGHDTVIDAPDYYTLPAGVASNVIEVAAGLTRDDLALSRGGVDFQDLVISIRGTDDSITVTGDFSNPDRPIAEIRFQDGSVVSGTDIAALFGKPTSGADWLMGGRGDDILDGGAGNDVLVGRAGSDTYVFGQGYGHDTVVEDGGIGQDRPDDGVDAVRMKDLLLGDLDLVRTGSALTDLTMRSKLGDDVLVVKDFFVPVGLDALGMRTWNVDLFTFGDGSVLTRDALAKLVVAVDADGDNDLTTDARGGTLSGGGGANNLSGGTGDDTYLVDLTGSRDVIADAGGNDTIRIGAGIPASAVAFTAVKDASGAMKDLLVQVDVGAGLTFRVKGQFGESHVGRIETVAFADGTSLTWDAIATQAFAGLATDGANTVSYADSGLAGMRIEGLRGADTLTGTAGSDTYVWTKGDGADVVTDITDAARAKTDTLQLQGLSRDDIQLTRTGTDLMVHVVPTGEVITIKGQFSAAATGIERILFDDGSVVSERDFIPSAIYATGTGPLVGTYGIDHLVGSVAGEDIRGNGGGSLALGTGDLIEAGGGDDTVRGGAGADVLGGEAGNDVIYAGQADRAYGGDGDDVVLLASAKGPALVDGGDGFDILRAGPGKSSLAGTSLVSVERVEAMDGADVDLSGSQAPAGLNVVLRSLSTGGASVTGTSGSDRLIGGLGHDVIRGSLGDDVVRLGDGGGRVEYASTADAAKPQALDIRGGGGDDSVAVVLDGRADILDGGAGKDRLTLAVGSGFEGPVEIDLSAPSSTLADGTVVRGFESLDLRGSDGDDVVTGGRGNDILRGGKGDDVLSGGAGDDVISGGAGTNHLRGGTGSDTFVLSTDGVASIADFRPGQDRLALDGLAVEDLVSGAAPLAHGRAGVPTLFYVTGTGDLYYAPDGTVGTSVLVGHLQGAPSLTGDDVLSGWTESLPGTVTAKDVRDASVPDPVAPPLATVEARAWSAGDGSVAFDLRGPAGDLPGRDTLALHGVSASDVTLARGADGTTLVITTPMGSITLLGQLDAAARAYVDRVAFDDGTTWTAPRLAAMADGHDLVPNVTQADQYGIAGDAGATARQVVDTGAGDQLIVASAFSDVVLWGKGDGNDTLAVPTQANGGHNAHGDSLVLKGLDRSDVTLSIVSSGEAGATGRNLVVTIDATGETFTVLGQFASASTYDATGLAQPGADAIADHGGSGGIEFLRFADGTSWDAREILLHATYGHNDAGVVDGTPGLMTLPAISAGKGNQFLLGRGDLGDTYLYAAGDGDDVVIDPAGHSGASDTLRLTGIAAGDVVGHYEGVDLVLRVGEGSVRLFGQAHGDGAGIERVVFDDGTAWDASRLRDFPTVGTGADEVITVNRDGVVSGGAGDDLVAVASGTVTVRYQAGDGNDTVRTAPAAGESHVLELAGLKPADVELSRTASLGDPSGRGVDLLVTVRSTGETVRVEGQFGGRGVDAVRFSDGTELAAAALAATVTASPHAHDATFTFAPAAAAGAILVRDFLAAAGDAGATIDAVVDAVGGHATLADGTISFARENAGGFAGISYATVSGHGSDGTAFTARAYFSFAEERPAPTAAPDALTVTAHGKGLVDAAHGVLSNDAGEGTLRVVTDTGAKAIPGVAVKGDYGTLTLAADGSYAYAPGTAALDIQGGKTAVDRFTYAVSDATGKVSIATLTVSVVGDNHAPVAAAASEGNAGPQDAPLRGHLLQGIDHDGDALSWKLVDGSASHGTVTVDAVTGAYAFTPDAGFVGTAGFSYVVGDGKSESAVKAVSLTFEGVNHAPTASVEAETGKGPWNTVLTGHVLAGADIDGNAVAYRLVENSATHGEVTLNADGSYAFTPAARFVGTASFAYVVTDGTLSSEQKVVSLTFEQVNHAPVTAVAAESGRGTEDAILRGVLSAGVDTDGDVLTFRIVEGSASHGTVTVDAVTGAYAFTPDKDWNGTAAFSYVVHDGAVASAPKSVSIDLDAVNDAPVASAAPESGKGPQDAILRGILQAGHDVDGDTLRFHLVEGSAWNGTVTIDAVTGAYAFTPDAGYVGPAAFAYAVSDGTVSSPGKTVELAFEHVNHAPVAAAAAESAHGPQDAVLLGFLAAGFDPDGDRLAFAVVEGSARHGSVEIDATTGVYAFRPDDGYAGAATFSYTVTDGSLTSAAKSVAITLDPVNHAPVASAAVETSKGPQDAVLRGVLAAGTDPDGDRVSYRLVDGSALHGAVAIDAATGAWTFTPAAGYVGPAAFAYVVTDGTLSSAPKTVGLTFEHVNHAPVVAIQAEAASGLQDHLVFGKLLAATDPDGDKLSYHYVEGSAAHGHVTVAEDGTFAFNPDAGYAGAAGFSYTVSDGSLSSGQKGVSLVFEHVNHAPVALDDAGGHVAAGATKILTSGALLANDTDADRDALTVTKVHDAVGGTATLDKAGNVVFSAAKGFDGAASFAYDVSDGNGGSATAHVGLTVDKAPSTGNAIVQQPGQYLMLGTKGDDEIHLSKAGALVAGNGGTDVFVLQDRFGPTIISDFKAGNGAGHDVLDVSALGLHNMTEVMASVRSSTPFGVPVTLIEVAGHGSILLPGVKASNLMLEDFHFA